MENIYYDLQIRVMKTVKGTSFIFPSLRIGRHFSGSEFKSMIGKTKFQKVSSGFGGSCDFEFGPPKSSSEFKFHSLICANAHFAPEFKMQSFLPKIPAKTQLGI
eukprot:Phypoly_transcript_16774.p1 GENE.Phypoly_transcript_16774~~Phypoly_transcript_16774.p1  ORF type:complete len:104 (-),score=11.33 Phypoly_transcript_16774:284-595(-)